MSPVCILYCCQSSIQSSAPYCVAFSGLVPLWKPSLSLATALVQNSSNFLWRRFVHKIHKISYKMYFQLKIQSREDYTYFSKFVPVCLPWYLYFQEGRSSLESLYPQRPPCLPQRPSLLSAPEPRLSRLGPEDLMDPRGLLDRADPQSLVGPLFPKLWLLDLKTRNKRYFLLTCIKTSGKGCCS